MYLLNGWPKPQISDKYIQTCWALFIFSNKYVALPRGLFLLQQKIFCLDFFGIIHSAHNLYSIVNIHTSN